MSPSGEFLPLAKPGASFRKDLLPVVGDASERLRASDRDAGEGKSKRVPGWARNTSR